jgi:hypothetical protein
MERFQTGVIALARSALTGVSGNVLDLGCGNAALLAQICDGRIDLVPYGVDANKLVLDHARLRLPQFSANFLQSNIFETEIWSEPRRYALALFMIGRFSEVGSVRSRILRDQLRSQCDRILFYSYSALEGLSEVMHQFVLEPYRALQLFGTTAILVRSRLGSQS